MRKMILGVFVAVSLFAQELQLFKEFTFGMSKDQVRRKLATYDCSKSLKADALCSDRYNFLGYTMGIGFVFYEDRLERVMLITPYTRQKYWKLVSLFGERFLLVGMQTSKGKLDLFEDAAKGEAYLKAKATELENDALLNSRPLTYFFLDQRRCLSKKELEQISSIGELSERIDPECREIDLIVRTPKVLLVLFYLPKQTQKLLDSVKRVEEF